MKEKVAIFTLSIVLGFWPGDPNMFGLLSFHGCGHLLGRPPSFGEDDVRLTVVSQAVLAGYAWLLAQAFYQGDNIDWLFYFLSMFDSTWLG